MAYGYVLQKLPKIKGLCRAQIFKAGLLLLPAVIVLAAFFFIPLLILVVQSLASADGFSLTNYFEIITHPLHRKTIWNSLWLSITTTLASLVLCTPIAFYLAGSAKSAKAWLRAGFLFPLSLPGIVVGFMIILLFGRTGLFPALSRIVTGELHFAIAFQLSGLFLAYIYFQIPRTTMILEGGVAQLDQKLEEAARSLGMGYWRTFSKITLPCLFPVLLSAGALCFATAMGAFGTAFTLARGFSILPMDMYSQLTLFFNIGLASAMAVVLAMFTLLTLYLYHRLLAVNE